MNFREGLETRRLDSSLDYNQEVMMPRNVSKISIETVSEIKGGNKFDQPP